MNISTAADQHVMAAWVQAVGTIAAILAAIIVVVVQQWLGNRRLRRHEAIKALRILDMAYYFGHEAGQILGTIDDLRSDKDHKETPKIRNGHLASLKRMRDAMGALPIHEMPSANSASQVVTILDQLEKAMDQVGGVPFPDAVMQGSQLFGARIRPFGNVVRESVELLNQERDIQRKIR